MIWGLMSRGYLCPSRVVQVLVGDGPTIVDSEVLMPGIGGGAVIQAEAPGLVGSVVPGPDISGSAGAKVTAPEAPSISGGIKPKIG